MRTTLNPYRYLAFTSQHKGGSSGEEGKDCSLQPSSSWSQNYKRGTQKSKEEKGHPALDGWHEGGKISPLHYMFLPVATLPTISAPSLSPHTVRKEDRNGFSRQCSTHYFPINCQEVLCQQ
jgi:hypothetical protein